jgi:hypothetical protein
MSFGGLKNILFIYFRHLIIHGIKFECSICGKILTSSKSLDIHQRDKHGILKLGKMSADNNDSQPKTQTEAELEIRSEAQQKTQPKAQPEIQSKAQPEIQSEAKQEIQSEAQPEDPLSMEVKIEDSSLDVDQKSENLIQRKSSRIASTNQKL